MVKNNSFGPKTIGSIFFQAAQSLGHINFRVKKLYICQTKTAKMYVQISTQIQLSSADNLILTFGKNSGKISIFI